MINFNISLFKKKENIWLFFEIVYEVMLFGLTDDPATF